MKEIKKFMEVVEVTVALEKYLNEGIILPDGSKLAAEVCGTDVFVLSGIYELADHFGCSTVRDRVNEKRDRIRFGHGGLSYYGFVEHENEPVGLASESAQ